MHWVAHIKSGPQRVNHAAAAVGDRIFTFGGYCSVDITLYANKLPMDCHMLHIHNLSWRGIPPLNIINWNQWNQLDSIPFLRYGHTAVSYGRKIYIWGGRNDQTSCNRLFCFDTDSFTWSSPHTSGDLPSSRDGHSASVIGNTMYIFGGFEEEFERFSQDVFALNLDTMYWSYVRTKGECPPYTDFHTSTVLGKRLYIFGGRSDHAAPNTSEEDYYPNEIAYLDTETNTWVKPYQSGNIPIGRRSHSAFVWNDRIYIFGGYNGIFNEHYNDMFCYNPESSVWQKVETFGRLPNKRRRQACIVIDNKMYLFGGTSPNFTLMCTEDQTHQHEHQYDIELVDHDDLHVLDLNPSLQTLCMLKAIENDLNDELLPASLREDLTRLKKNLLFGGA